MNAKLNSKGAAFLQQEAAKTLIDQRIVFVEGKGSYRDMLLVSHHTAAFCMIGGMNSSQYRPSFALKSQRIFEILQNACIFNILRNDAQIEDIYNAVNGLPHLSMIKTSWKMKGQQRGH